MIGGNSKFRRRELKQFNLKDHFINSAASFFSNIYSSHKRGQCLISGLRVLKESTFREDIVGAVSPVS